MTKLTKRMNSGIKSLSPIIAFFLGCFPQVLSAQDSHVVDLDASAVLAKIEKIDSSIYDYSKYTHPILGTHLKQQIENIKMTPTLIRQLSEYHKVTMPYDLWTKWYSAAEKRVIEKFCNESVGKTQNSIISMYAPPFYCSNSIPCWNIKDSPTWIYRFGPCKIPVVLTFVNGKCIAAKQKSPKDMMYFAEWLDKDLMIKCKGKTVEEIERMLGRKNLERFSSNLAKTSNITNLRYEVYLTEQLDFKINSNTCTSISRCEVSH